MEFKSKDDLHKEFVLKIDSLFENGKVIYRARNVIKVVVYDGEKFIIKSFKNPSFFRKLEYLTYKKSKAQKSYDNSIKILDTGLNVVAKPIGYNIKKSFGLITNSYFISTNIKSGNEIRNVFSNKGYKDRKEILKAFAKFTLSLHNKNIFHEDYSPGNILFTKFNNKYKFYLVDINRVSFKRITYKNRVISFSKFSAKDNDLTIMATEYAKLLDINAVNFCKAVINRDRMRKKFLQIRRAVKKFLINK